MRIIFLLLLLNGALFASAQSIVPRPVATLKGQVRDSLSNEPLIHAVVGVSSPRDTLYTVTDREGGFSMKGLAFPGKYRLSFSFLGYAPKTLDVRLDRQQTDLGRILMSQQENEIEAVVVRDRTPLMSLSGDTIQYNAAAVKVLQGSETIELIRRLPGLEVADDGYVSIMGKRIDETRVDNRLIFGNDPRDALMNLPASDVVKVQVYDVRELGRRGLKKVMNLQTRSKLDWNFTVNALVSYGADTEKGIAGDRQQRYGGGSEINFFSEQNKLKTDFLLDNIGRLSNRLGNILKSSAKTGYSRNNRLGLQYENRSNSEVTTRLSYRYADDYALNRKLVQQFFFPQEDISERLYADTTTTKTAVGKHAAGFSIGKEWQRFGAGAGVNFTYQNIENHIDSRSHLSEEQAGALQTANPLFRTVNDAYALSTECELRYSYLNREASTEVKGKFELGKTDGEEIRIDTLSSSSQRTDLKIGNSDRNRDLKLNVSHFEPLHRNLLLNLDYELQNRYDKSYRLAWDNFLNRVDTAQSNDFTFDYLTQRGSLSFQYRNFFNAGAGLSYQYARQNRDERIAVQEQSRRGYTSWLPSVYFEYLNGPLYLVLKYTTNTELPSCEMVRNQIDSRNPLLLKVGNPELKQSSIHNIEFRTELMSAKSSLSVALELKARFVANAIVARQQTLLRDTVFTASGGYRASAGAIMNSYANAGGGMNIESSLTFNRPVRWLGCMVRFSPRYNYTRSPEYVGRQLLYTEGRILSAVLSLNSTFSRKFDFKIMGTPTYAMIRNSNANRSDYMEYRVTAEAKWLFLSRCFLYAQYSFSNYHSYNKLVSDQTDSQLNAALGVNFAKDNRCAFSISAFDLLNSSLSFSSKMLSNYVVNTWRNVPGRYFTCNFSYRLNKSGNR